MSFFDMPAGYNDADMEMVALEDAGNRFARRYKGLTREQVESLAAGRVEAARAYYGPKGDRTSYDVLIRATDADEIGPCGFEYSTDLAATWHDSPKAARLAREAA